MKHTVLTSIVAISLFLIPSCSSNLTEPTEPQELYASYTPDWSYSQPNEIKERPNKDTSNRKRDTNERKKDSVKKRATPFFDILVKLNLSDEQKEIADLLLSNYNDCVTNCTKPLRDAQEEILKKARASEEEIKKLLKDGKITKAQARERLDALKKRVNESLRNLPFRERVQECIRSCEAEFIKQLELILNPEQKKVLRTWLESRRDRKGPVKKDSSDVKPRG